MNNVKPTLVDLAKYVEHLMDCGTRWIYLKEDGEYDYSGPCDCGLNDLLTNLGLKEHE